MSIGKELEIEQADGTRWDAFVASSPQGSPFSATCFLAALGVEYDLWLVSKSGRPQAGAVVLHRQGVPIDAPYTYTLYQGLLLAGEAAALPVHRRAALTLSVLEGLLEKLAARYARLSFCLHPAMEDSRALQWFNYHNPERGQFQFVLQYTGVVDLTAAPNFEGYLDNIREVRRQDYRRALANGLTCETSGDIDVLDRLHQRTFERQNIERSPEEQRLLRAITSAVLKHGCGELLICRDAQGQEISATLFLHDQRCGYYLFAANDPAARSKNGNTFLLLENIKRCFARGARGVDMIGINSPQRGDFKTSFNAAPRPYFITTWTKPAP